MNKVFQAGTPTEVDRQDRSFADYIAQELSFSVTAGEPISIEKIVAVYTSRDPAIAECGLAATTAIERAGRFDALLQSHSQAWQQLWSQCDMRVEGNSHVQLLMHFHLFHLLQTVSPNTRGQVYTSASGQTPIFSLNQSTR